MKQLALIFALYLLCHLSATSQITLDYVDSENRYALGNTFNVVDIDENETKYYFIDTASNQFSLFNMDFTPFIENVQLPGEFRLTFAVYYISRQLFDCDPDNIEFIYAAPNDATATFKILRTDGTELFSQDSTIGFYCYGCLGGSQEIRPIRRTSDGTKMFLGKYNLLNEFNPIQTQIYSLCGDLPSGMVEQPFEPINTVKVYPNPTQDEVSFEVQIPPHVRSYDLVVYDRLGKKVWQEEHIVERRHSNSTAALPQGTYFYTILHQNNRLAQGTLITVD